MSRYVGKIILRKIDEAIQKSEDRKREEQRKQENEERKRLGSLSIPQGIVGLYISGKFYPQTPLPVIDSNFIQKTADMIQFIVEEIYTSLYNQLSPYKIGDEIIQDIALNAHYGLFRETRYLQIHKQVISFPMEKPLNDLCISFRQRLLRPGYTSVPLEFLSEEDRAKIQKTQKIRGEIIELRFKNEFDKARSLIEQLLDMNPNDIKTIDGAIDFFKYTKDWKEASKYLKMAINLFPQDESYLVDLANSLKKNNEIQEGIENYIKALKLFPNYHTALFELGDAYTLLKEYDYAMWCFNKAKSLKHKKAKKRIKELRKQKAKANIPPGL